MSDKRQRKIQELNHKVYDKWNVTRLANMKKRVE